MKPDVRKTPTLSAFAACWALIFACISSAAEPVVIEVDLPALGAAEKAANYIVQAANVDAAAGAVESVGGTVTHEIAIIQAVRATLLPPQVELLKRRSDVLRVFEDTTVTVSPNRPPETSTESSSFRPG